MKTQITNNKIVIELDVKSLIKQFQKVNPEYKVTDEQKFAEAFMEYVDIEEYEVLRELVELEGDNIDNWAELI